MAGKLKIKRVVGKAVSCKDLSILRSQYFLSVFIKSKLYLLQGDRL